MVLFLFMRWKYLYENARVTRKYTQGMVSYAALSILCFLPLDLVKLFKTLSRIRGMGFLLIAGFLGHSYSS
jgi:hypothetical protein